MQDKFLYHPYTQPADLMHARQSIPALEQVSYKIFDDIKAYAWFVKPSGNKPVIVFMHGNACNIGCFLPWVEPFFRAGYGIFMPEYSGFGGVGGTTSQETLEQSVVAGISYLNNLGYKNQEIVLYGFSLGTYLATYAAYTLGEQNPFAALILEAPFTSVEDVAAGRVKHFLPVGFLLKDKYPSALYIDRVNTPVFIAHGKRDKTVPYELGVALFKQAKDPKMFYSAGEARHTDLRRHGFPQVVLDWLQNIL